MNTNTVWDKLSTKFDTYRPTAFVGAVDNMLTIWPEILKFVDKHIKKSQELRALEYGCGAGMFCRELKKKGFEVVGIDISPRMIKIAKKHLGGKVIFLRGDSAVALKDANQYGPFNFISAIMVFQFIKDIKTCLKQLSQSLKKGGYIIFAVHDPKFLAARGAANRINLAGTKISIPIYPKNLGYYNKIFKTLGFKKLLEKRLYPSKKFIQHMQKKQYSLKTPKYLLLAYKKVK